jgi:hypothetical protein
MKGNFHVRFLGGKRRSNPPDPADKSPDDYVSVGDFYKVYGYACLYAALNNAPITDLTITFIESRYPKDLIKHLMEVRGYQVDEKYDGIYIVSGDIMPIQIINSKKLSADDNIWLRDLNNELDIPSIKKITAEIERQGIAPKLRAYIYAILQANQLKRQEALEMSDETLTFIKFFEEAGLTDKWEARGEARGKQLGEIQVLELMKQGYTAEQIEAKLSIKAE